MLFLTPRIVMATLPVLVYQLLLLTADLPGLLPPKRLLKTS